MPAADFATKPEVSVMSVLAPMPPLPRSFDVQKLFQLLTNFAREPNTDKPLVIPMEDANVRHFIHQTALRMDLVAASEGYPARNVVIYKGREEEVQKLRTTLRDFARESDAGQEKLSLPPMPAEMRYTVRLLARDYGLVALSESLGVARHPVVWRSPDRQRILARLQAFVSEQPLPVTTPAAAAAAPDAAAVAAAAASGVPAGARVIPPVSGAPLRYATTRLEFPPMEPALQHTIAMLATDLGLFPISEGVAEQKHMAVYREPPQEFTALQEREVRDLFTRMKRAAAASSATVTAALAEGETVEAISSVDIAAALQELAIPEHYGRGLLQLAQATGSITVGAFCHYLQSRERELRAVFTSFDRSQTGRVRAADVLSAMRALGIEPTSRDFALLQAVLTRASESGDAGMSFVQFRDLVSLLTPADLNALGEHRLAAASHGFTARAPATEAAMGKSALYATVASALSGGIANAFSRTVVAPFERVRLQMSVDPGLYSGMGDCLKRVYDKEGIKGLWRGNVLNVIRIAPQGAISFLTKDLVKDALPASLKYTSLGLALASMMSGAICMSAVYPLDMVRARVTTSPGLYPSWQAGLAQIYKQGGWKGLFEGVHYSNAWAAVYYGVQFYSYDSLKRLYAQYRRANGQEGPISPSVGLVFGAVSGTLCVSAAYPFEAVRRKLQVQGFGGRPVLYEGWWDCVKKVVGKEGARGLFRGLGANMVKTPPSIALTFWAYELLMKNVFHANVKA